MYLNLFAQSMTPQDMTDTDEFKSLLQSAADLGIPHSSDVKYVSRNTIILGLRLHFLEWGEPGDPAILLLHGGNQSAHSWDLVSLHLADRYHVLALDQRGHGDSEWARDLDYTLATRTADVVEFMADQDLVSPIVMGHSMGGLVAMTMALSHPESALGLVLVDVGPELSKRGTQVVRDFVTDNVEFNSLEEFVDRVARYDSFRSREHLARTLKYNLLRRVDGKYGSKVDHRRLPDASPRVPQLGQFSKVISPALVVRGAESEVLEAEPAERFVAALPNGRLATVPRCGHNVHSQNTLGFLNAVAPFLADLGRS